MLAEEHEQESNERLIKIKMDAMAELEAQEERGEGDRWSDKQQIVAPAISELKDFDIEMMFSYNADDGTLCLGWYHGKVVKILNEKTNSVSIRWSESCLGEDDTRVSDHKLLPGYWNLKVAKSGGWRQHFDKYALEY